MNTGYILGVSRGHNSGVCLLKDGEVVFSIEEERLSRNKYDGTPFAAMSAVLKYTDKVDYIVVVHTQELRGNDSAAGKVEYTGDDVYTGLARKLGLIDRKVHNLREHPQVIDMSRRHHAAHAALAFYNSGFETAAAVVVDGAGTMFSDANGTPLWEVESVLDCSYDKGLRTTYKHMGCRYTMPFSAQELPSSLFEESHDGSAVVVISDKAGIVKAYEAVTQYCGFSAIEAGKTMGLSPYGSPNAGIPEMFTRNMLTPMVSRDVIIPTYPNAAILNSNAYAFLAEEPVDASTDLTSLQSRRDAAYWVQASTQEAVLNLIKYAAESTGNKNIVLSGGYGLNCVANYYYLDTLREMGINLYVEPMSNDGGTAIGAALLFYYENICQNATVRKPLQSLYLGLHHSYVSEDFYSLAVKYGAEVIENVTKDDIVNLLMDKNIVCMYQGRSENGPRALGNRSVLFDPTFKDGKDYVNSVKRREYFRPFAASVLAEHASDWFDLKGMQDSPFMMYAVNCNEGVSEQVPSVIHEDGTCRIQTVSKEDNRHYHELITAFMEKRGVPMLFNTSFNLGGEPLVETLEDAYWTLASSELEYCYFPEHNKLVCIKN